MDNSRNRYKLGLNDSSQQSYEHNPSEEGLTVQVVSIFTQSARKRVHKAHTVMADDLN